ncbi:MAG: hypothetical protein ACR2NZ_12115 [Rubripirellula sp.]
MRTLCLAAAVFCSSLMSLASTDQAKAESPALRIVLFSPSDVDPPAGVRERLKEYVMYSQAFYGKWMNHWGYECENLLPVKLDEDGYPEIFFVRGRHDEASGVYAKLGFQDEVVQTACRQHELDPKGQVWWIFTYKGPSSRGFRGGGNAQRGGTSTSIYDATVKDHLNIEDHLGGDESMNMKSKAAIHELGHAFGLPHIGPLSEDKLGNSLMGPVIKAYRSRYPDEPRVYLTRASAAMLWKHPLFSGTTKDRDAVPTLDLSDFSVSHDAGAKSMTATGSIDSNYRAHSVVIANESSATRSDYWRKCFVGRVAEDGSFEVEITEPDQADGQLKIVACFNNGAVVGKRPGLGLATGFLKRYEFAEGEFQFADGWADKDMSAGAQRRRRQPRK